MLASAALWVYTLFLAQCHGGKSPNSDSELLFGSVGPPVRLPHRVSPEMQPPSYQDYVSVDFPGPGGGSYNNNKHWRRQSCWRGHLSGSSVPIFSSLHPLLTRQPTFKSFNATSISLLLKWKQLSRLQRSLILFILALLFICGIASFPTFTEHLRGLSEERATNPGSVGPELPPFQPVHRPPPVQLKKIPNKRGPPVLQNRSQRKGNTSETVSEDTAADKDRPKVISWHGAVIDTELDTDDTKAGQNQEDSLSNQEVKLAKGSGARLEAVREAFRHAWKGYKDYAWGHDELRPISKSYSEWFGLGLTLIDALDTMWILGLKDEFEEAKAWVATELTFNKNVDVNLFESTIRILGGLLSTYHLTGDALFLDKAFPIAKMLYSELLKLWDESVQAMDRRDWQGALEKLQEVQEPTSRILFNAATANLALGHPDMALKCLDLTISKDEHLAVGFFQRAAVNMQLERLEDALSDCIWAQKHMRKNAVIDYKQLGLRFKLCSWQVLHNAAAVYCRMDQWEQAREVLLQGGGAGHLEAALDSIERRELPAPLMVPESLVFRPRKQEVEQLQKKDFLGKAKVISSLIPNDDFGGFEPLRQQRPGFYEPKAKGAQESRYMRVRTPYMARAPEQLTVPGGVMVFLFGEEDRDGMINVIHDGQRGLLPVFLLEPAEVNTPKAKKDNRVPSGIPLPPGLQPPGRPQAKLGPAAPSRETPPPSPTTSPHASPSSTLPLKHAASTGRVQQSGTLEEGSVVVKVHYTYTVAVTVPLNTPYHELKQRIAQKLGHPASELCLRHKQQGSHVLSPLSGEPGSTMQDLAVAGRATLWCQKDDPLVNRQILYQMVALYNYDAQGPEDLEFSEGDTIDILSEVNEEWLEGHCAGNIGIFPSCFAYRENNSI